MEVEAFSLFPPLLYLEAHFDTLAVHLILEILVCEGRFFVIFGAGNKSKVSFHCERARGGTHEQYI